MISIHMIVWPGMEMAALKATSCDRYENQATKKYKFCHNACVTMYYIWFMLDHAIQILLSQEKY